MNDCQSIIDGLKDAVFLYEAGTSKILFVNKSCTQIYGYPAQECINGGLRLLISNKEEYCDEEEMMLIQKASKGERITLEKELQNVKGDYSYGEISVSQIEINSEQLLLFSIRDITAQKKAIAALEDRELLLDSINHNISEGVYRSYSEGGLIYANDAFAKMFGYESAEDIMNVKSLDLYAKPKERKGMTQTLKEKGYRSNVENHFKRKDGSTFLGSNSFVLTSDHEGNEIFDGAVRDITHEKKAAEKLNKVNAELLERNFELDQLVYKTSHDLRSPLRSMLGLTNLMKVENSTLEVNYFEKIEDRILKMDGFIKSMLDYSRASRMELKMEQVDLKDLTAECISSLEYLDGFKEFVIIENYQFREATIDRLRLAIVFSNIISNAFKYRNPKAKECYLKIDVSSDNELLKIVFEDNGIGIAKKYLDKVFDMFYRATEMSEGSGLGMYIVKQALDKLNGKIAVESKLGIGTKISIEIPEMNMGLK